VRDIGLKRESISRFSYENASSFFLEEDCDANKGLEALRNFGYVVSFNEVNYNNDAPIRDYKPINTKEDLEEIQRRDEKHGLYPDLIDVAN
jgi:hypothetical protein